MKTIDQAAEEYLQKCKENEIDLYMGDEFKAGVEFAQQWISVDDELPDKDNYNHIFLCKCYFPEINDLGFMTASWRGKQEWQKKEITHWRPIEFK